MVVFHRYCNLAELGGKLVNSLRGHLAAQRTGRVYVNVVFWSEMECPLIKKITIYPETSHVAATSNSSWIQTGRLFCQRPSAFPIEILDFPFSVLNKPLSAQYLCSQWMKYFLTA